MDLVYICKDGDNEELRYSIRSAVANLPHDNIWVVGGKPEWYSGNHLAVPQTASKVDNVRNNILKTISSPEVSESFILMNDDFFILNKIDEVETYYDGYLYNKIKNNKTKNSYFVSMNKTFLYLAKLLKKTNIVNYDIHVPMILEKEKVFNVLNHPTLLRSTYGNMYNVNAKQLPDVKFFKINKNIDITGLTYISTEDQVFEYIYDCFLKDMFPDPSPFECP